MMAWVAHIGTLDGQFTRVLLLPNGVRDRDTAQALASALVEADEQVLRVVQRNWMG
jgi:hypothetical protein